MLDDAEVHHKLLLSAILPEHLCRLICAMFVTRGIVMLLANAASLSRIQTQGITHHVKGRTHMRILNHQNPNKIQVKLVRFYSLLRVALLESY